MFRIVSRRTAWWPVRFGGVTEDGKIVQNEVELRFIILDEDAIVDFYARLEQVNQSAFATGLPGDTEPLSQSATILPLMLEVVDDWRGIGDENGKALPFSPDNFLQFLKVPNVGRAVGAGYRDCRAAVPEARAGN